MTLDAPSVSGWPPDPASVKKAASGDRDTLGGILQLGYPRLVSFFRGMGMTPETAQDLASETTEAAVKNLTKLRSPEAFEGWYWAIARNRFKTHLRRGRIRVDERVDPLPTDPADQTVENDEHRLIREALEDLPIRDRQLLWLREVEELEYEDIARRLSLKAGAVRVATMRARTRLADAYRRRGFEVID